MAGLCGATMNLRFLKSHILYLYLKYLDVSILPNPDHRTPVVEGGIKRCFQFLIVDPKAGGRIVEGSRVLGMIDRETKEVRLEICPNNKKDKDTFLGVIWKHVAAQTTMTDCWKGYEGLDVNNFRHLTVNQSLNFIDPKAVHARI
ncbi:hypothetical protein ANN_27449 [Periplaneta americana]|uniref:ISXO2-like transposase domain-containing protein n=1 Tax=Periplaneta americana TaxID=6978 RepID=A0ABQ8RVZ3_PERAM|nr:hypothetical protein ANN_27449 [Periplaneta americana]